jgi:hypothetical protein
VPVRSDGEPTLSQLTVSVTAVAAPNVTALGLAVTLQLNTGSVVLRTGIETAASFENVEVVAPSAVYFSFTEYAWPDEALVKAVAGMVAVMSVVDAGAPGPVHKYSIAPFNLGRKGKPSTVQLAVSVAGVLPPITIDVGFAANAQLNTGVEVGAITAIDAVATGDSIAVIPGAE